MKWILWIVTAVPVITAGAVLHFKLKESVGGKWNILPKCLATWMIFCTALAGVLQRGNAADAGWIAAALGLFLAADFMLGNQAGNTFGLMMQAGAGILAVPYFLSLLYVFGVQSRFVNPVKATIRYSFFMALRNMKYTIQMAILMILFVWINTTTLLANFLTLIYGFGLMGYFFALYYQKTFEKYLDPKEKMVGESITDP